MSVPGLSAQQQQHACPSQRPQALTVQPSLLLHAAVLALLPACCSMCMHQRSVRALLLIAEQFLTKSILVIKHTALTQQH
jgi:hypothetical protein